MSEALRAVPLAELELGSPHVTRALRLVVAAGINTVGQLRSMSESELAAIPGIGPKGIEEIKEILAQHGLALRDDDEGQRHVQKGP